LSLSTAGAHARWLPFGDPSRTRRLLKVLAWIGGVAAILAALELAGVDIFGWFSDLWNALGEIPPGYLVAGWTLQTAQTALTALAWFYVLRAGFPGKAVAYRAVFAAYATGVALNGFLPGDIGTVVTMLMFVALIPGATFAAVLGGAGVQKLFFVVAGAFVWVYLFVSVQGSFEVQLGGPHDHPVRAALLVVAVVLVVTLVGRVFWPKLQKSWERAKQGGAILGQPRRYLMQVILPSLGAWLAKLGVIALFLAGYGIAVTFHSVMSVMGGNGLANTIAVTPGGVGINQAANVVALGHVTDAATANAYSLGQQLAITGWNIVLAVVLVIWAFGWTGGKLLVEQTYRDAKRRVAQQSD
jgi:uncharacterized membrane protein YbhN (UPF0104 family)